MPIRNTCNAFFVINVLDLYAREKSSEDKEQFIFGTAYREVKSALIALLSKA